MSPLPAAELDHEPYDFAIVGAGASGLLLAMELVRAFEHARVVLVDPGFGDVKDRTFAFWYADRGGAPLAEAIEHTWSRLRLATPDREVRCTLDAMRYHVIGGAAFRDACLRTLAENGRVHHHAGRATALEALDDAVRVHVDRHAPVIARWAFDSRFERADVPADPRVHVALTQRFLGWEIEAEADALDPDELVLFDFRVPQGVHDVRFVYVLPFDRRRALVEHVSHDDSDAEPALRAYVEETLGIARYRVLRVEAGQSPLTDARFVRREGPRALRIGVAGGRLKPSSGYAYVRMAEDAQAIVRSLREHGHPFDVPEDPPLFRALDALLLRVMRNQPEIMPEVFLRMFEHGPADRVFRLLDERARASEVIALGLELPASAFARELARWLAQRFGVAMKKLGAPIEYEEA